MEICNYYDKKLKYFRSDVKKSLGSARNTAIEYAEGVYLSFLDVDDYWIPQKLEWQVSLMEGSTDFALIYSNVWILNQATSKRRLFFSRQQPHGKVFQQFLKYYPINLQTVMIRTDSLKRLNEMFDNYLSLSEEYDLFMRLLYREKAYYMPQPTAIYRIHANMASKILFHQYHIENRYILNKLRRQIPGLDSLYPKEARYLEAKLGYWAAISHIEKCNQVKARHILFQHCFVSPQFFLLYILTFFPRKVWFFVFHIRSYFR
jgi:glycosyltransferase involved in cell wall biosynthesis